MPEWEFIPHSLTDLAPPAMIPPPPVPSRTRVPLWSRVSTEDQAKWDSPQNHEERGRQCAAATGWTVLEIYRLEGVSGKSVIC